MLVDVTQEAQCPSESCQAQLVVVHRYCSYLTHGYLCSYQAAKPKSVAKQTTVAEMGRAGWPKSHSNSASRCLIHPPGC